MSIAAAATAAIVLAVHYFGFGVIIFLKSAIVVSLLSDGVIASGASTQDTSAVSSSS